MSEPGPFPFFSLLENFSWSSSSSSTPQYSARASFSSPRDQPLNPSPAEVSSRLAGVAGAGLAATRGTVCGAGVSSAAALGHLLTPPEKDSDASPEVPWNVDSTSKTTCSLASTKKFCDAFAVPAEETATGGLLASAATSNIRPATSMGGWTAAAPVTDRESCAFGPGRRGSAAASAALPVVECLTFAAGGGARRATSAVVSGEESGGGPCRGRRGEGGGGSRCFRGLRLLASLLMLRDPLRDAAVSSVSCGCYIFLLAASVRFSFQCISDRGAPLMVAKTGGAASASDSENSFSSDVSHFSQEAVPEPRPLPVPDGSSSSPPLLSPRKKLRQAPRAAHTSSIPLSPCPTASSSGAAAFPSASPAGHDSTASPPPSSSAGPLHSATPSATTDSSSSSPSAAALSADVAVTPLPSQEWPGMGELCVRVAYSLCAAWAAAGACAAVAALLTYRSHGGILTAGSMLDVRFSVDRESTDIETEEYYAEWREEEADPEESEWLVISGQVSHARSTAEGGQSRAAENQKSAKDFRVTSAAGCSDAGQWKEDRGGEEEKLVARAPLTQPGQLQQQQEQLQTQADGRQQLGGWDEAAQLSQQQQDGQQQEQVDQRQEPHPQEQQQPQQKRASGQQVSRTCRGGGEQAPGDTSARGGCRRQAFPDEERTTPFDATVHDRRISLGISFMGQGQIGSFGAAIRRGSVSRALSSISPSSRDESVGSSVPSSSMDHIANRSNAAGAPATAVDLSLSPADAAVAAVGAAAAVGASAAGPYDAACGDSAASRHARSQRMPAAQHRDHAGRILAPRKTWVTKRAPQQQQEQHPAHQQQVPPDQEPEPRLVPLLASFPLSFKKNRAPYLPRPSLGSWMASYLYLAAGGSLCACLQELLLLLAVALERQRPSIWSVVTCFSYSDWITIDLIPLALRYWGAILPRPRARGALVVAAANAVLLLLLFRSSSAPNLTQPLQEPAVVQASSEASKGDSHEPAAVAALPEEPTKLPLPNQKINVTVEPAPSDWSGAVVFFAVLASVCALLADISLAFCLDSGVSVISTVIIRCSTQGAIGAAGILYGLIAGNSVLQGKGWQACSSGLLCPALAGVIFGPLTVYAFSQSVKRSTLLLGATVRSTCWVVVALLALLAHSQPLSSTFASALSLTFAGTCLFAWDSREGSYATRQDTDEGAQDYRVSSDQNEGIVFSSPVYHELVEHGQVSGDSSLSSRTDKPSSCRVLH